MANLTSNQVCNICCIHYNSGLRCCPLGCQVQGGHLFAKQGGLAWIVACQSREVVRNWANRNDAVTAAQAGNPCGDWFIPSRNDLVLGHDCKVFWQGPLRPSYWSNTEWSTDRAWDVCFTGNNQGGITDSPKICCVGIRAFRRVFY
jgi:hypothetical protein